MALATTATALLTCSSILALIPPGLQAQGGPGSNSSPQPSSYTRAGAIPVTFPTPGASSACHCHLCCLLLGLGWARLGWAGRGGGEGRVLYLLCVLRRRRDGREGGGGNLSAQPGQSMGDPPGAAGSSQSGTCRCLEPRGATQPHSSSSSTSGTVSEKPHPS